MKPNHHSADSNSKKALAETGTLLGGPPRNEEDRVREDEERRKQAARREWLYLRAEAVIEILVESFLEGDIDRDQLYPGMYNLAVAAVKEGWNIEIAKLVWRAMQDVESSKDGERRRPDRETKSRTPRALHKMAFGLVELIQEHERLPNGKKPPVRNTTRKPRGSGDWRDACEYASEYLIDGGIRHASPQTVESWRKAHLREIRSNSPRKTPE